MPSNFSYFDDLEDHVESTLNQLSKGVNSANDSILDLFTEFYYKLDKSTTGGIKTTVANLKKVDSFRRELQVEIDKGVYNKSVSEYLKSYKDSSKYINDYFSSIVTNFKDNDNLYKAVLESNVSTTANQLLGSGVNANFTDPMTKILKDMVTSGSNKKQFIETIKKNLSPENSKLIRYSNQVASDSITQFNSNYINTISSGLALKYYYYKGTKIEDTRPFCSRLAGKYITEDQLKEFFTVQSLSNDGKGWSGMIKGTNWSNFPTYRGGWSCRHYLIPVSKAIYERATNKF